MSNPQDKVQYIVRVSEVRANGEWPVSTAQVSFGGACLFSGKANEAFGPLYATMQKAVSLFVAGNIVEALKAAAPIREQLRAAEKGAGA